MSTNNSQSKLSNIIDIDVPTYNNIQNGNAQSKLGNLLNFKILYLFIY